MVELHEGFEGFEKLGPQKKKKKQEDLMLAGGKDESIGLEPKPDLKKANALYDDVLSFTKSVLDKVAEGKEDQINSGEILDKAKGYCEDLQKSASPDDLVRLIFKHDDFEDNYLYAHSVNVCFLSVRIALELNFSKERLHELVIASLFHDIGMMKVPIDIWNRNARLTSSEYEEVQKHALYGEEIFKNLDGMGEIIPTVIGQHQERVDGTGYPRHLTRDNMHYLSRLVSLVDRYEANTHTRLWRPRYLPDKTIQQILDHEAGSFDPHFIKAMLRHISIFPVGTWVKVSSGEIGDVIRTNEDTPMRPVVDVVFDREKKKLAEQRMLDLSKQLLIHVEQCVDPRELQSL